MRSTSLAGRSVTRLLEVLSIAGCPLVASALNLDFGLPFSDEKVEGVLNSTFTAGVGIRMQSPNVNLIGKSNLNPEVCSSPPYQSCQGLFRTQSFPAAHLAAAPGTATVNGDDGDLNYRRHGIFQAPLKLTQDLTLNWKNFGFFGRILFFYDARNNAFT